MQLWQALILGVIQGVGESFPVSSLAQTILLPALLRWQINQADSDFLAFVVALHLATAIALVLYFWKDWRIVVMAYLGSLKRGKLIYDSASKFAWLLAAGTVIVGGVGAVFEKKFRQFFDNPDLYWVVAAILVLNGVLMILGDIVKRRAKSQNRQAVDMTLIEGAAVGAMQTFALFPGISPAESRSSGVCWRV